jgi:toxin ParE1/3/4
MTPGFVLTAKAKADLKDIARYTEKTWGHAQRNQYLTVLDASFHALAAHPLKGRDCSDIRAGYRKFGTGRHVIFYRQIDLGIIEIVRILHERMDVKTRLTESDVRK